MQLKLASDDLKVSIGLSSYIFKISFMRVRLTYSRSFFSFFWETITVFFVATILALVWSKIFNVENKYDYFCYVLVGFSLWNLLFSKLINRAVLSFSKRYIELTNQIKPISILPLEEITYSYICLFMSLPFVLAATVFYTKPDPLMFLVFFAGLVLVLIASMALALTLGVLTFFLKDFYQLVEAVMRISFLITPILWDPSRLGEYEKYVLLNPFYSFLDICRSPLLGHYPEDNSVFVALAITTVLCFMAVIVFSRSYTSLRSKAFE